MYVPELQHGEHREMYDTLRSILYGETYATGCSFPRVDA